jgi:hemoglobin
MSLYERFGGEAAVAACVEEFYARVLADDELAPFFAATSMEKLFRMQRELFTEALDGPATYSGMSLYAAHAGRGIRPVHLARFSQHLLETLRARNLSEDDVQDVVRRVALHAEDITAVPTSDG